LNITPSEITQSRALLELSQGGFALMDRSAAYTANTLKQIEAEQMFFKAPGVNLEDGEAGESQVCQSCQPLLPVHQGIFVCLFVFLGGRGVCLQSQNIILKF
jgi:hypothetical protein